MLNDKELNKLGMSELEFDALRECGNVGIGNAATALAKLVNKKVDINIPETKFIPLNKLANEVGGPENIVSAIYLEITGDLAGEAIFVFPENGAKELVDLMMGQEIGTTKLIGELEESAVKEMSNIFIGSYLNSMGDMLDLKLFPEPPHTATDMAQAIIDFMLIKLAQHSDDILIVREEIKIEGHNIDGIFIIIFDNKSLEKIIETLKEKYGVLS